MTITYDKFMVPTRLTTSAATMFTIPASPATTLLRGGRIRFTNTTAGAESVTAHAVPPAGSASDTNAWIKGKSIPANDYMDFDVPIMPAGSTVQALASAADSISAHMISGSYFS